MKPSYPKRCPHCQSSRFIVLNGIAICRKCNYQHRVIPKADYP